MKYQAELLSCLTFKDRDGEMATRLGYRLRGQEYAQETDKFKGYSELSYFSKGTTLFNKFKKDHFGTIVELTSEEQPSKSNPLRKVVILKSIKVGNELIDLL